MVRTFVALLIPPDWAGYLGAISRALSAQMAGLSWVKQENIHITLRFLGDLGESGARRAGESVARSAGPIPAPEARLGAVGAFPSLARPRVVWVGLGEGEGPVTELARAVNEGLRRDGFGPPDKPFRAHLTLARVRDGARGLKALSDLRAPEPPPIASLDRVAVMKSDLLPSGARYTALQEVRLRPPDR
jgi:2'-5' RNA ligase